jgi:ketosteroid isomerase-like protein
MVGAAPTDGKATFQAIYDKVDVAYDKHDLKTWASFLASEYVYVTKSGQKKDKPQEVREAQVMWAGSNSTSGHRSVISCKIQGNHASVIINVHRELVFKNGKKSVIDQKAQEDWVKGSDGWKVVHTTTL